MDLNPPFDHSWYRSELVDDPCKLTTGYDDDGKRGTKPIRVCLVDTWNGNVSC
jgi:hypothetical protein